jgi:hypothetical protein
MVGRAAGGPSEINVGELEVTDGAGIGARSGPQSVHAPITKGWPHRGQRSARVNVGVSLTRCTARY